MLVFFLIHVVIAAVHLPTSAAFIDVRANERHFHLNDPSGNNKLAIRRRSASSTPLEQKYPSSSSFHVTTTTSSPTQLYAYSQGPRYDNLVGGLAQISLGASLCVLYSEWNIILTGCGPMDISDFTERFCYQIDILTAGIFWFVRLAFGSSLTNLLKDDDSSNKGINPVRSILINVGGSDELELENITLLQVTWAEWLAMASVGGALIALLMQFESGAQMDGLSGIDIKLCKEKIAFQKLYMK